MSAAPTGALDRLRERAAVLVDFDLNGFLRPDDPVEQVLAFLDSDCELVPTPDGGQRWSITVPARMRTLQTTPVGRLRQARASVAPDPSGPVQQALDRALGTGWTRKDLSAVPVEEARSIGVIAAWFDGARESVPKPAVAQALVDRLNLFSDVRAMARDHFVGRADILDELRAHFSEPVTRPFLVHGVGGIGKSALVARHLVWCVDHERAVAGLVDFDDPVVNPHFPVNVVAVLLGQLADQVEGNARQKLKKLEATALDEADTSSSRSESPSRASSPDYSQWQTLFTEALDSIPARRRLLLVFDTLEQVQRRGPSAVASVAWLVGFLAETPRVRVLVSGRAEAPEIAPGRALRGLDPQEAVDLLIEFAGDMLDRTTADALVDHLGTSPLTIRLTGQLLRRSGEGPGDLFGLDVLHEQVDAFLYDRVLGHLDKDVRALAHPGLVLRRITPDVIRKVLAMPCGFPALTETEAEHLFNRLADEPMLVDRDPGRRVLTHRGDVRAVMLPQLLRDRRVDSARIQRAAIRYYAAQPGTEAKLEELYHRLLLGQSESTLSRAWDARAAQALVPSLDELPVQSRIFVASRLEGTYLRPEDRALVDQANWVRQVYPQALLLMRSQSHEEALRLLRERVSPAGGSLIPDLEIEALEYLGRIEEATSIAHRQRQAAALRGDPEAALRFGLHLARLLERSGDGPGASAVLEETLEKAAAPDSMDLLRVLVAWLGVARRTGAGTEDTREARAAEAVELHHRLGSAAVLKVPGLVRDLAAETGSRSPEILLDALQTVGLDARESGDIPAALRLLSADVGAGGQESDMVADLLQLPIEPDEAEVRWEKVATKSRGDTGRAISEVLLNFGPSSGALTEAVTHDFQAESDAAYFIDGGAS